MPLMIDAATQLCAVIGNPVAHSLSPRMHNAAFEAASLNYVYLAFKVEDAGSCLAGMRALPSFRGMSVTIPHKQAVMAHLDEIDPIARRVGAVNTVVNTAGRLRGLTTDGPGTLRAFEEAGVDLEGRRVLFVGTGGAVRSVAFAMSETGRLAAITLLGRTAANVASLAYDLSAATPCPVMIGSLSEDLRGAMGEHDVVIQGTPVGMYPETMDQTVIPAECLRSEQVVFDMVYRPMKTRLIREAEAAGCQVILGAEMLLHQATLQFEAWTEHPAPVDVMRKALHDALSEER